VIADWEILSGLQQSQSPLYQAICTLKSDLKVDDPKLLTELADVGYVTPHGKLTPLVSDILDSALIDTPEGPVLRYPIDLEQPGVVVAVKAQDALTDRNVERFIRELPQGPENQNRPRGS
jgi:hypothetical protein